MLLLSKNFIGQDVFSISESAITYKLSSSGI